MDTNMVLLVLLGVLVLMAGVQAFQLTVMAKAISSGAIVSEGASESSALSQLPTQVGGC